MTHRVIPFPKFSKPLSFAHDTSKSELALEKIFFSADGSLNTNPGNCRSVTVVPRGKNSRYRIRFCMHEESTFALTHHLTITTRYDSPLEMAHSSNSSNVIVHGTLNSVRGDYHIHNKDSESGTHDFHSEEHPYQ